MTREQIENYLQENGADVEDMIRDYDIQDIIYGYSEPDEIKERLDKLIGCYRKSK